MAWANYARCLHCGARLALYRKFTDGEFCSAAHRAAYGEKQEQLAVERLQQTQELLNRAASTARTEVGRDEILRQGPPTAGPVPVPVAGQPGMGMLALDPMAYDFPVTPVVPAAKAQPSELALARAGKSPMTGLVQALPAVRVAGIGAIPARRAAAAVVTPPPTGLEPDASPVFKVPQPGPMTGIRPLEMPDPQAGPRTAAVSLSALGTPLTTWLPLPILSTVAAPGSSYQPPMGESQSCPMPPASAPVLTPDVASIEALPAIFGDLSVPALADDRAELHLELSRQCLPILPPEASEAAPARPEAGGPAPLMPRPALPWAELRRAIAEPVAGNARLLPLEPGQAVAAPLTWGMKSVEWMPFHAAGLSLPTDTPALRGSLVPSAPLRSLSVGAPPASMPDIQVVRQAIRPPEFEPGPTSIPRLRITPLHITREGHQDVPRVDPNAIPVRRSERRPFLSGRIAHFAVMLAPVTFLLIFLIRQQSTEAAAKPPAVSQFVNAKITDIRAAIQNRAGIEYLDDFRSGLDNWDSSGSLDRSWSYDQTGFVKPGPLAVFRPSLGMSEYSFEFLGQIDRRALSWVYRAEDLGNYHVAKLVVLRPGPLPTIGLVRYSVIKGRETRHIETVLPLNVHTDTIYRVRLEARGNDFSLYVQNQMVQFWSDWRLPTGGVGFFSGHGEQSRIRWMQISHQYDAIGKLCAYFAPMAVVTYNLQPTMGARTE